jgi:hypothetical protein
MSGCVGVVVGIVKRSLTEGVDGGTRENVVEDVIMMCGSVVVSYKPTGRIVVMSGESR